MNTRVVGSSLLAKEKERERNKERYHSQRERDSTIEIQ